MAIEHKDIPDADLHEPKGVATAAAGEMFVADGLGSGAWQRSGMTDHGEMNVINNITATAVTAAADPTLNTDSDYVKITAGWTGPHVHGVSFNVDELVVITDGHYSLNFWASIKVPLNNNFLGIKFAINDGTPYSLQKLVTQSVTTSDYKTLAGLGGVDLVAGDTVSIYLAASKSDSPIVEEAGVTLVLVHVQ